MLRILCVIVFLGSAIVFGPGAFASDSDAPAEYDNGACGTETRVIDWRKSSRQTILLSGDCALQFVDGKSQRCVLRIVQDNKGGHGIAWPRNVKWPNGGVPARLTAATGAEDIAGFYFNGTYYYGAASMDYN